MSEPSRSGFLWTIVRRPVAVLMVVIAVAVFGGVSLTRMQVNLLPDVSYPSLTVRTEYEGAAPIDVEKLITRKLEEQLAVISNLVSYRSISRAGVSDVILEFEWDTPMTFAMQDVREKVAQLKSQLPDRVSEPLLLRYDPTLDPIMRVAIYEPDHAEAGDHLFRLRRLAEEELKRKLETIPGVAAVRVRGGYEDEWRVELDEHLLKLHGVSASQVFDRIASENVNVAGGRIIDGDREILVRTVGEITSIQEIEDLAVDIREGRPIRIRDVGRVVADKKERDVITRIQGTESVELEIFKEAAANTVDLAAAVKTRLFGKDWEERLDRSGEFHPGKLGKDGEGGGRHGRHGRRRGGGMHGGGGGPGGEAIFKSQRRALAADLYQSGIHSRLLSDQSIFIRQSQDEVLEAGLMGAVLAILVLYAFLRRLSPTLIISVTIPVSVLATFTPLLLSGVTLNIMSLGGLALGIGMLVDSAIVVLESITRKREEGLDVEEAAVEGTRSVGMAVVASTLTTIAVFFPIVFVKGIAGEFFRDQSLAVVYSLMASLLAAIFFIPMLASRRVVLPGREAGGLRERLRWLMRLAPWSVAHYLTFQSVKAAFAKHGAVAALLLSLIEIAVRLPLEFAARTALLALAPLAGLGIGLALLLARVFGLVSRPLLHLFDRSYRALEQGYDLLLRGALKARLLVVLVALASFAYAAWKYQDLGVELVPPVHQGEFTIESQLAVGTPLDTTDALGLQIQDAVLRALEREDIPLAGISSSAGVARDVIAKAGEGRHTSKVHVRLNADDDLEELEERAITAIRAELDDLPEIQELVFTRPTLFSQRMALEVEVIGADLERIGAVGDLVAERLRRIPGLRDVKSTHKAGHPELVIRPDRDQMAFYDLHPGDVAEIIRSKVQGAVSTRITLDDRKVDVLVRVPQDAVNERSEIMALRVNPLGKRPIPLSAVATVEQRPGPAEIRRVGGERAVVLSADVENIDLRTASRLVTEEVSRLRRERPEEFRDVIVRVAGQSEESERSLRSMLFAMAIAVFLVYVVMASQFESLVHPFVILFSIPLALVGVVIVLDVMVIKLSVVVLIGVILLAGIVVNNAIVLVDCVNQHRRAGLSRDAALQTAAGMRLRPILMTTATTVLGLLPMAIGLGQGTEIRAPMAITVIAGLTTSTLLTLVVIPVVYSFLAREGSLAPETVEAAP